MAGITTDLDTPATSVGNRDHRGHPSPWLPSFCWGPRSAPVTERGLVFQIAVAIHGLAMAVVALSQSPGNAVRGASCIRRRDRPHRSRVDGLHRHELQWRSAGKGHRLPGQQQSRRAGVLALLIAGSFATTIGWRYSFALVVALAVVNLILSFRVKPVPPAEGHHHRLGRRRHCCPFAVILLSFGFSGLNSWGVILATGRCAVLGHRCFTRGHPDRPRHHLRAGILPVDAKPQGAEQASALQTSTSSRPAPSAPPRFAWRR